MSSIPPSVSACRHCLYYQTEGRRGGTCHQLGVPVQAQWKACPLAAPCFATSRGQGAEIHLQPAIAPVIEAIPMVAVTEVPTAAEVIPITGLARRPALRSPSLMA